MGLGSLGESVMENARDKAQSGSVWGQETFAGSFLLLQPFWLPNVPQIIFKAYSISHTPIMETRSTDLLTLGYCLST